MMRIGIVIFAINTFFLSQVRSQENTTLSTIISFKQDSLYLLDPWQFSVQLKNEGMDTMDVHPIWLNGGYIHGVISLTLEIKEEPYGTWSNSKIIEFQYEPQCYQFTKLMPGESISLDFFCMSPYKMLKTGSNELRVTYTEFCSNRRKLTVQTPSTFLQIKNYEQKDKEAYEYINALPKANFVFYEHFNCDLTYIEPAEYLIEHFPESRFITAARLYLPVAYLGKAQRVKSIEEGLYCLRRSKQYCEYIIKNMDQKYHRQAKETMKGFESVLFYFYNLDPPEDLLKEFKFHDVKE